MSNKNGGVPPLIIGFLALIFLIIIVIFFRNNHEANQQPQNQMRAQFQKEFPPYPQMDYKSQTKNWPLYTNKEWKYSFRYPPQWKVVRWTKKGTGLLNSQNIDNYFKNNLEDLKEGNRPTNSGEINFGIIDSVYTPSGELLSVESGTNIDNFISEYEPYFAYNSNEKISLDGKPGNLYTIDELTRNPKIPAGQQFCPNGIPCSVPTGKKTKRLLIKNENYILEVNYRENGVYPNFDKMSLTLDQILSTFKFTN